MLLCKPDEQALWKRYREDWNAFAAEMLNIYLDPQQQKILNSVRKNRRTTVKSGHARGKDFVAAAASLAFLYLTPGIEASGESGHKSFVASKVVLTAPTGRQVYSIMMAEIGRIKNRSNRHLAQYGLSLPGEMLNTRIKFDGYPEWYLEGFKASDNAAEAWTGYHSGHILIVVSEASGISDQVYNAIEGNLTGDSRLLLVGNPVSPRGEFHRSFQETRLIDGGASSKRKYFYNRFTLNCLDAPNVVAKKTIIPGQVDYHWVDEHVQKVGWTTEIGKAEFNKAEGDFEWEGKCYRPSNLFRVKVLGEFPREGSDVLVPLGWIELAQQRWLELGLGAKPERNTQAPLQLGVDVAGMGADLTVFCHRQDNVVLRFEGFAGQDHMETSGKVAAYMQHNMGDGAFIDTIGEGAGVYSRLAELQRSSSLMGQAFSVKFSENANGLSDMTGEREFFNMRAYCYWAVRDALDPKLGVGLALPPDDSLLEELSNIHFETTSNGKIRIQAKDKIKESLGRSPDFADALANSFYPVHARRVGVGSVQAIDLDPLY